MRIKNRISNQVHLFTVQNSFEGKALIESVRRQIKQSKTGRRIVLYGRGHRFGKGSIRKDAILTGNFDNSFQSHVPLTVAENIAVYISG